MTVETIVFHKLARIIKVEELAKPDESDNSIIKKMFGDIKASAEYKQLYFESLVYLIDIIEKVNLKKYR